MQSAFASAGQGRDGGRNEFDVGLFSRALAIANSSQAHREAEDGQLVAPDGRARGRTVGKLYAWGGGEFGRLGHGDMRPQMTAKLVEILREKNVRRVACGARHSLALTGDCNIYSWGYGGDGQLGHGDLALQTMPVLIKVLEGEGVVDICCGDAHSVALTSGGDVYTWGDGSLGQLGLGDQRRQHTPRRVTELQGRRIVAIAAGAQHTAAVDADHNVFTWGSGQAGRLGLGDEASVALPTLVESLQGVGVQAVHCFRDHTLATTAPAAGHTDGLFDPNSQNRLQKQTQELESKLRKEQQKKDAAEKRVQASRSALIEAEQNAKRMVRQNELLLQERVGLYMKVQALEAGLATVSTEKTGLDQQIAALVSIPTRLAEIQSRGVRQIACGAGHIVALAESGDVYSWGAGGAGQLGLGKRSSHAAPQLVWGLMRKGVRQVGAGRAHSAALTYNGLLYTWGSGSSGQLGHGDKKSQLQPKLVEVLDEEARNRSATVRLVGCGHTHTVAALSSGDLYMWGKPEFGILGRAKGDGTSEPVLIEALWQRDVVESGTDRSHSLGKADIAELLDQHIPAQEILRYYPDLEDDPQAALFLSARVTAELERRVEALSADLELAREEKASALESFIADQERAFELREREGLDVLHRTQRQSAELVEAASAALKYQEILRGRLEGELREVQQQLTQSGESHEEALAQARTAEKASLAKALRLAHDALQQSRADKQEEVRLAREAAATLGDELEQARADEAFARVEVRKHEKLGLQKSLERVHALVAQASALSQRLQETALEHIDPAEHGAPRDQAGLRKLIELSNAEIDQICAQAVAFAADDNVDVALRQQLATLLLDNAEMRKQLNAYTEGILMQAISFDARRDHPPNARALMPLDGGIRAPVGSHAPTQHL